MALRAAPETFSFAVTFRTLSPVKTLPADTVTQFWSTDMAKEVLTLTDTVLVSPSSDREMLWVLSVISGDGVSGVVLFLLLEPQQVNRTAARSSGSAFFMVVSLKKGRAGACPSQMQS